MAKHILMPVRTVAEWGGVHEWALTAVQDFVAADIGVTVVGKAGTFRDRIVSAGGQFLVIDWDNWERSIQQAVSLESWDLVFSHGPLARNFGMAVAESQDIPIHHMIHGAYLDHVNDWAPRVTSIIAASPSVQDFVVRVGKIEPWKVAVVANGVPDGVFDLDYLSLAEKLKGGTGTIVTAARLSPDKVGQIDPTIRLVSDLAGYLPDIDWTLDVMGDGPLRNEFQSRFAAGFTGMANVAVEYSGWVDPAEVPIRMNRAVAACVAGMGGVRALAAGTLTLGVGAQGSVGIQMGQNLRAGVWSNFGDHGCPRFTPTDQSADLRNIIRNKSYDEVVQIARNTCRINRSEKIVKESMFDVLGLIV